MKHIQNEAIFAGQKTFVAVPSDLIDALELDPTEKILYLNLYKVADNRRAFPTTPELMEILHIKSNTTMRKYFKKLEEKNLITIQQNFGENGIQLSNTYIVQPFILEADVSALIREVASQLDFFMSRTSSISNEELQHIATEAYGIHRENAVYAVMTKFLSLDKEEQQNPITALLNALEDDAKNAMQEMLTDAEKQLAETFENVSATDKTTLSRLTETYPEGVVRFALESVKNKEEKRNWGYITTTVKRLAQTCHTYEECVEQKKAFFAKKDEEKTKQKAATLKKQKVVARLINLGQFGNVENPTAYAKKVLSDKLYEGLDEYELFDVLTGVNHMNANSYDPEIFNILFMN